MIRWCAKVFSRDGLHAGVSGKPHQNRGEVRRSTVSGSDGCCPKTATTWSRPNAFLNRSVNLRPPESTLSASQNHESTTAEHGTLPLRRAQTFADWNSLTAAW
jgi:hypothetical protein